MTIAQSNQDKNLSRSSIHAVQPFSIISEAILTPVKALYIHVVLIWHLILKAEHRVSLNKTDFYHDDNDKNSYLKLSTYNSFSNNKIQLINFTTSFDDFRADTNQQTLINLLLSLLFNFFYEDTTKKQAGKVLSFII